MKNLWTKFKELWKKYEEAINYLIWGGIAFVLYILLFRVFADYLGLKETLAVLVDNLIVIIFAFFTNKYFVFKTKSNSAKEFLKEFFDFFVARIFTMVLSEVLTWFGCDFLGYNKDSIHISLDIFSKTINISDADIVQLIIQVIVIVANYILSKLWIFKGKEKNE